MDFSSNLMSEIKREKSRPKIILMVGLLILLALCLHQISKRTQSPLISFSTAIMRSLIYFGLFISWGLSVRRRVMQKQVRTYLTLVSSLMVLWLFLRTTKYYFVAERLNLFRHLWYAYYTPMLFILLMGLFIALSMGKPEDYRLPKGSRFLYIPTLILAVLVLTNDYHHHVFQFTSGIARNTMMYKHNIGFWIVFAWIVFCTFIGLLIILSRSRGLRNKKLVWLPFLPLFAAVIYTFMYVSWTSLIKTFVNDMTVVLCLLIIGIFESCIYTGLIRSNSYYGRFFYASGISALIVDKDFNMRYKSKDALFLSAETLRLAQKEPVNMAGDIRLSSFPITGGNVFWLEDVSEMNHILLQLKETGESLAESNKLVQAELELKERKAVIDEKDRLYNKVIAEAGNQLDRLNGLLAEEEINKMKGEEKLIWFCVLGAYIKRRWNLIILSEDSELLYAKELEYSIRESSEAISDCGVDCFFKRDCDGYISTTHAFLIYDIFQEIIELFLPSLEAIFINLVIKDSIIKLNIQIEYNGQTIETDQLRNYDNLLLHGGFIEQKREDETLHIKVSISRGADS